MRLSDRKKLIKVLLLIVKNNHISASSAGLAERADNRNKAIKLLSEILHISEEHINNMYEKHINKIRVSV